MITKASLPLRLSNGIYWSQESLLCLKATVVQALIGRTPNSIQLVIRKNDYGMIQVKRSATGTFFWKFVGGLEKSCDFSPFALDDIWEKLFEKNEHTIYVDFQICPKT